MYNVNAKAEHHSLLIDNISYMKIENDVLHTFVSLS